jgi:phosphopantothenoylcysteine decarboxylase/phosphopantothenate--cysteine ligase
MGVALAEAFRDAGADVTLVLGPVTVRPGDGIRVIHVETAEEMYQHTVFNFGSCDLAVCAAAVSDYRPVTVSATKIKKKAGPLKLELERTRDILAELGQKKQKGQFLAGFALETGDLKKYATEKLRSKKVDVIIANLAGDGRSGIGADMNEVTIFDKNNKITKFELKSKREVAKDIVSYLGGYFK